MSAQLPNGSGHGSSASATAIIRVIGVEDEYGMRSLFGVEITVSCQAYDKYRDIISPQCMRI